MKSRIEELTKLVVEHSKNRDAEKYAELDAFTQIVRDTVSALTEAKTPEFQYSWTVIDYLDSNETVNLYYTLIWDSSRKGVYLLADDGEFAPLLGRKAVDRLSAMEHFENFLESFLNT